MLAARGESTTIAENGEFEKTEVPSAELAIQSYQPEDWNTYTIIASGESIEVALNGHVTSRIEDLEEAERELSGILALQLHSGPPMKVQFKEIVLETK